MTVCSYYPECGGCAFREFDEQTYQQHKLTTFQNIIKNIRQKDIVCGEPVYLPEETRRRATMAFRYIKKNMIMGFNAAKSHDIINNEHCFLLTAKMNKNLPTIRHLVENLCQEPYYLKKGKKYLSQAITQGDIYICEADNGLDVMLDIEAEPELNHRMIISEIIASQNDIVRLSWKSLKHKTPEVMIEKTKPILHNHGVDVYIPCGTFLQASKAGEEALINLVLKYIGNQSGKIADLFCGVGTFSYPLAQNKQNQILAIDSSIELLEGFAQSVHRNQIKNIKIEARNLFKYPLTEDELKGVDILVFDPPRAGAAAQAIALAQTESGPQKFIAVSCNPHTFVNDANTLIGGGYKLKEITMVDQFIYSRHTELVALFEKEK